MAADSSTLVILHFPAHKGKGLLGPKWATFRQSLRSQIEQHGILDDNSDADLLIFLYSHPYIALSSLFAALEQTKKEIGWKEGSLPVQLVLHLQRKDKDLLALQDPAADLWDVLHPETVYLTRTLKLQWEQLMANKELPAHSFAEEEGGFYKLKMSHRAALKTESLFPHRGLATLGKFKECFYCGRWDHKPAACPSKKLTMAMQGMPEAGYQSFQMLAAHYKEAFADPKSMVGLIADDVTPAQIRENLKLQAYLAYFDVFLPYQFRFLWYVAFNPCVRWHEIKKEKKTEIDSPSFNMGIDCLRVGQYDKAEEFLEENRMRREGKLFYAKIAQAFRALELDRMSDTGTLLESALTLANHEKEQMYANLLLIRHHALHGDHWKADQVSNHAMALFADQPEMIYARIQVMVRSDFGAKVHKQLQGLIQNHRKFFLSALLDPTLLPIQGLVENLLSAQIDALLQTAGEELAAAEEAGEELKTWFREEDPDLEENLKVLATIQEQHQQGSYFDLLDVVRASKALVVSCQRLSTEKVDSLLTELDEVETHRYNYYIFWKDYPAKPLFGRFIHGLAFVQSKIEKARALLKEPSGDDYHAAVQAYEEAKEVFIGLPPLFTRMILVKEILNGIRVFGRKLLLAEGVLGGLGLLLLFVLPGQVAVGQGGFLHELADPVLQKQALVTILAFVAPLLSLILTIWDLKNT